MNTQTATQTLDLSTFAPAFTGDDAPKVVTESTKRLNAALAAVYQAQRKISDARHEIVMSMEGQFSLTHQRQLMDMDRKLEAMAKRIIRHGAPHVH